MIIRQNHTCLRRKSSCAGILNSRKGFITDIIVDFWAVIVFVLVVIVFAVLYKWTAEARMQAIEDLKDLSYGNYLSTLYLRKPVIVQGTPMTMAELIAIYDYNQTLEKSQDKNYAKVIENAVLYFAGKENDLSVQFRDVTEKFIKANFDDNKCYAFMIKGHSFEFTRYGDYCALRSAAPIYRTMEKYNVPKKLYVTYLPPIDPREKPIEVYVIYDVLRFVATYSDKSYEDINTWLMFSVFNDPFRVSGPLS